MAKLKIGSGSGLKPLGAATAANADANAAVPAEELIRQEVVPAVEDPLRKPAAGSVTFTMADATPGNQALAFFDGYELPKFPASKDDHLLKPVEGVDRRDPFSAIRYAAQHGLIHPDLDRIQSTRDQKLVGNILGTALNEQRSSAPYLLTNVSNALVFDGVTFTGQIAELVVYTAETNEVVAAKKGIFGRLKSAAHLTKPTGVEPLKVVRVTAMTLSRMGLSVYADPGREVFVVQTRNANMQKTGFARLEVPKSDENLDNLHFVGQHHATNSRRLQTLPLESGSYKVTSDGLQLTTADGNQLNLTKI